MSLPTHILNYLVGETARQHAESVDPMLNAFHRICLVEEPLSPLDILSLANAFGQSNYRITPVTFTHGLPAMHSSTVPQAMERLLRNVPERENFYDWLTWIKHFLDIHPFEDGNGRIASLLFNWGMKTLDVPIPLPYYRF